MKDRNALIWNMIVFTIISFLIAGFQTSFWPSIFKVLGGANLWLFLVIYISIYRNLFQGLLFVYINTVALHCFTFAPIGMLLTIQITILVFCNFLRSRIFWNTSSYFLIISALGIVLFETSFLVLSNFFEVVPAKSFSWKELFITLALTPAIGFFFFSFGRFVDSILPAPKIGAADS